MTRVKRGNVAQKRRKKILLMNKGFRGSSSKLFRTANQRYIKSLVFRYYGRKQKKRLFRSLWITRINGELKNYGKNYSQFYSVLKKQNILLNRKSLAQLIKIDNYSFEKLINILYQK
uniref:Large ribosomal subunit protein bL20c n=1 Tax=Acetabularia acetabulum TaxID=35845 RepID=W6M9Z4_ACEAT|nr:chloroplast 50S ribosomal protein L20 [Acetabularia acetabulum]